MALSEMKRSTRSLVITLILAAMSSGLYILLYMFSEELTGFTSAARSGELLYAFIPIIVALVFSFVHGAFTGHFWNLLGLRAKKQSK